MKNLDELQQQAQALVASSTFEKIAADYPRGTKARYVKLFAEIFNEEPDCLGCSKSREKAANSFERFCKFAQTATIMQKETGPASAFKLKPNVVVYSTTFRHYVTTNTLTDKQAVALLNESEKNRAFFAVIPDNAAEIIEKETAEIEAMKKLAEESKQRKEAVAAAKTTGQKLSEQQAEADAKAKAEADEKAAQDAKAAAEAKEKAEAEAEAQRKEKEAQELAEAEEKAKTEAEALEAKAKEEAEAAEKAKADAEAAEKAAADAKAAEAEQKATTKKKAATEGSK